jgi:hypothetical protein
MKNILPFIATFFSLRLQEWKAADTANMQQRM